MNSSSKVEVVPSFTEDDWNWLRDLWLRDSDGETMVYKGTTYHFQDFDSVIAWVDGIRAGAVTYSLDTDGCELMSVNATGLQSLSYLGKLKTIETTIERESLVA